jgi:hypothetical protein
MPSAAATSLRFRAHQLRRMAAVLRACRVFELAGDAGPDTWRGPTADRFIDEVVSATRKIRDAADGLDAQARSMEQQADHLDLLAALAAVAP